MTNDTSLAMQVWRIIDRTRRTIAETHDIRARVQASAERQRKHDTWMTEVLSVYADRRSRERVEDANTPANRAAKLE